jgi:hypothetical protein
MKLNPGMYIDLKQWKHFVYNVILILGMDDTHFHIPAPISEPHVEIFHLFLSDWILQTTDSSHPSSVFTTTAELLAHDSDSSRHVIL